MDATTIFMAVSPLIALACYIAASAVQSWRMARQMEESNRRNGLV